MAEVNPHVREAPKAPPGRVVGTVAPQRTGASEDIPVTSSSQTSVIVTQAPATSIGVAVVTSTQSIPVPVIAPVLPVEVAQAPTEAIPEAPAVTSTAPTSTSPTTVVNDADQLPEEPPVEEVIPVQPKPTGGQKRSREPSCADDDVVRMEQKRPKQETVVSNPEPIEVIEEVIEQTDLDAKSDDEVNCSIARYFVQLVGN